MILKDNFSLRKIITITKLCNTKILMTIIIVFEKKTYLIAVDKLQRIHELKSVS